MAQKQKTTRYLDPKNDLTFRRIFGEHPHIVKSFLNSVLPLAPNQIIEHIEYLEPELIPELPELKRSMVDVHCTDNHGRYFLVEMQMYWSSAFKKRMLFNTGKAFVRQLKGAQKFRDLKPVYGLSLVNDIIHPGEAFKDIYYHHYNLVHNQVNSERIEGLELIFIELPKFKAKKFTDKKMQTLWLRFLTEIDENSEHTSDDLTKIDEIKEALECVIQSAFTELEMLYYDKYWDAIRLETIIADDLEEQEQKAEAKAEQAKAKAEQAEVKAEQAEAKAEQAEAKAEQERKDKEQIIMSSIQAMYKAGMTAEIIANALQQPLEKVINILKEE